jgi:tetratricopeptide (TPR) repeat protein
MKNLISFILAFAIITTSLFAVGGKPDGVEVTPSPTEAADYEQPVKVQEVSSSVKSGSSFRPVKSSGPIELTDDEMEIIEKYNKFLKQKQFSKALEKINLIPVSQLNEEQQIQQNTLLIYSQIDIDKQENERQFGKDESLDAEASRTVKRLQREAKLYILSNKTDLARDILIQSLYLDRKNYTSKQLLERNLELPLGSYRVENIEAKYWKESLIQLRSGYPAQSVDSLTVLASFDPENSAIFERMGSSYYLAGHVKKAIEAWKRALYLDQQNVALKAFIENAEEEVKRQDQQTKAFLASKKKAKKKVDSSVEMQVLRIVGDSNTAYSYAQEVRQQMPGKQVSVEELDNGKWAVKIAKDKKEKK